MYSEEYLTTMASLKNCLENRIYTEEALEITERALNLLASHYTAWCFRLDVIKHLNRDLFEELDWCEEVALENEKNYQIWNYRQRVIELILANDHISGRFSFSREFPILQIMLGMDAKNHHVWLYRNWLVTKFDLFDNPEELKFVCSMIEKDIRNNSAWAHRYFLRFGKKTNDNTVADLEIQYAKEKIALCPQNPSSWNYLFGVYRVTGRSLMEIKAFCMKFANVSEVVISSSFALEALAKISIEENEPQVAAQYYDLLLQKYDPMRAAYWLYLKAKLNIRV